MYSLYNDRSLSGRVSPFRNRRVVGYLLLTAAYRSLSRLSSALSAKASTLRSFLLDHFRMYSVTFNGLVCIKLLKCLLFSVLIHSITLRCLDISSIISICSFQGTKGQATGDFSDGFGKLVCHKLFGKSAWHLR